MKVEQLMSTQVQSCRPEDTLAHAAQMMWERDCGCLPVCRGDGSGEVVATITDRDICMAAFLQHKPLHELNVSEAMARALYACRPEDAVADVENTMRAHQVRRLPVVDEQGRLVGLISLADLAREAALEAQTASGVPDLSENEVGDTLAAICQPGRPAASAVAG